MKKRISILLSLVMILSVALPFVVYAQTSKEALANQVNEDILGAVDYLHIPISLDTAVDTYTLFRVDQSKKNEFLAVLDQNLADNSGKIISNGREDVVSYACIINILTILGEDVEAYNGYDIKALFENIADKSVSNPYYYRVVTEACRNIGNKAYADYFINELKASYTFGSGFDYWGFSCDNTAMFLAALSAYKEDYSEYIADAKAVIEKHTTSSGCFYSEVYTDVSPDSTACAMLAFASLGEHKKARVLYDCLMNGFESSNNNGVIMAWGAESAYTTKEALLALSYFEPELALDDEFVLTPGEPTESRPSSTTEKTEPDNMQKSPQTGVGVASGVASIGAGMAILIASRRKKN